MSSSWKIAPLAALIVVALVLLLRSRAPSMDGLEGPEGPPVLDRQVDAPIAAKPGSEAERVAQVTTGPLHPSDTREPDTAGAPRRPTTFEAFFVDPGRRPLADVRLSAADAEGAPEAASDGEGFVSLVVELPDPRPDELVLSARGEGLAWLDIEVAGEDLNGTEPHFLGRIVLDPGGSIAGGVVHLDGRPALGARVYASHVVSVETEAALDAVRSWGRPYHNLKEGVRPRTSADAEGRFLLQGVPTGFVMVFADARGTWSSFHPSVSVRAGEVTRVPDLVLEVPPADNLIAGTVLAAEGTAVPASEVYLTTISRGGVYPAEALTDEAGHFRLVVARETDYVLAARDPAKRLPPAELIAARGGMLDVELRFQAERWLDVAVTTSDGGEPGRVSAWLMTPERHGIRTRHERTDGGVRVLLPEQTFNLYVDAPGYRAAIRGPFEPRAVPEHLAVELARIGGLSGRVLAAGEPRPGAQLHAHHGLRDMELGHFELAFLTRCEMEPVSSAESGPDGAFFIPLDRAGPHYLHAEAPGFARGATGLVTFRPGTDIEGLRVELERGGAIEGRVLVAGGALVRGTRVGASSGDGHVAITAADEEGRYRFENLTPGGWQVARVDPLMLPYLEAGYVLEIPDGEPVEWPVEVLPGRTTRHDIDLRHEVQSFLRGRFLLGGSAPDGWVVLLEYGEEGFDDARAQLDTEGRFEMPVDRPGRHRLALYGPAAGGDRSHFTTEVEIEPGFNDVDLDLEVGTIELAGLAAVPPPPDRSERAPTDYAILWQRDSMSWRTSLASISDGRARIRDVPAGRWRLVRRPDGSRRVPIPSWETVVEFELRAGETCLMKIF